MIWLTTDVGLAQLATEQRRRRTGAACNPLVSRLGTPDERILCQRQMWASLPPYVRPMFYFVYRYILPLGFLGGRQGFVFHVLAGFWFGLLVDVKADELGRRSRYDGSV